MFIDEWLRNWLQIRVNRSMAYLAASTQRLSFLYFNKLLE